MKLVREILGKLREVRRRKRLKTQCFQAFSMVEVTGFEPATFWSRTKRATKLRYTSIKSQ